MHQIRVGTRARARKIRVGIRAPPVHTRMPTRMLRALPRSDPDAYPEAPAAPSRTVEYLVAGKARWLGKLYISKLVETIQPSSIQVTKAIFYFYFPSS